MRICLVSNEILGAHRNGGIGTATSHLALLLARYGHAVTLFYVGPTELEPDSPWVSYYQATNVTVRHFLATSARISPSWMKRPVEIFECLQDLSFDVILFQEWMALGHACMVAKRTGVAFHRTTLAIITHSNSSWLLTANRQFPKRTEDLALIHMEQQAIALADSLISPSHHLQGWMRDADWKLPERTRVIPYFLEGPELLGVETVSPARTRQPVGNPAHLAFFGRLEERKGISIFLAALASEELKPFRFKLSFLGRPATKSVEDIRGFVAMHRPDLLADLTFEPNLSSDEAQTWLAATDCMTVIPSLIDNSPCVVYECLKLRLPFITTASGGTPELIDAADRDRCLFDPTARALAARLRDVLSTAFPVPPRPAYDQREIGERWLAWFEEQAPRGAQQATCTIGHEPPDTTIIITHHERPALVEQTLRALAMQSDTNFDVILVDDGSKSAAALAMLDRVERGIAGLPIKVVRQSNKYLGAARNTGVRHARSRFVVFLDDDNIPFPTMVEVLRRAAHVSDADIVTCQMQFFLEPTGDPDTQDLISGERWAFSGGPVALGVTHNCFGDATGIYRRDAFDRVGYFHEIPDVTHEDWQWHLRAGLAGLTTLSLPLALFWYRVTSDSMIRTTSRYDNMQMILSVLKERIPQPLSPILDLMVGMDARR